MNNINTLIFGFIAVMAVGFLIVAFSEKSEEQKTGEALLMTANMLNVHARDKCTAEGESRIKGKLYSPSDSSSDGNTYVQLTWKATEGTFTEIVCRYERDKGVTQLTIDGKPAIP